MSIKKTDLDNHITREEDPRMEVDGVDVGDWAAAQIRGSGAMTTCDECRKQGNLHPVYVGERNSGYVLEVLLCSTCYGQRRPVSPKAQKNAVARQSV